MIRHTGGRKECFGPPPAETLPAHARVRERYLSRQRAADSVCFGRQPAETAVFSHLSAPAPLFRKNCPANKFRPIFPAYKIPSTCLCSRPFSSRHFVPCLFLTAILFPPFSSRHFVSALFLPPVLFPPFFSRQFSSRPFSIPCL